MNAAKRQNTWVNVPNLISLFRIVLIGIYLYFFYGKGARDRTIAMGIVLLAGLSDGLDGWIARKWNLQSKVGAALDPLADKLMSITVFLTFVHAGYIPLWFFLGILVKELVLIAGGIWLYFTGRHASIPSNLFGKAATGMFYLAIILLLFPVPALLIRLVFLLVLLLNWIALGSYLQRAWQLLQKENPPPANQ